MCWQNPNKQVAVESTFSSVTPVMLLKSHTGCGDASNSVGTMVEKWALLQMVLNPYILLPDSIHFNPQIF